MMLVLAVIAVMVLYGTFVITSPGETESPAMNWREAIYWSAQKKRKIE